jgi:hypothetical protein
MIEADPKNRIKIFGKQWEKKRKKYRKTGKETGKKET